MVATLGEPIQFKRGQKTTWENKDLVLLDGEPGWDRTARRLKIGDGLTPWTQLPYVAFDSSFPFRQNAVAAQWTVPHNLGKPVEPVIILDNDPMVPVWTDVEHVTNNLALLIFPEPVSGWAYF